ncbi:MAG TPA: cupin domain-containing protein [Phycisphaerales bacterium]|nr:cupin domain-containing protein [Phycisphaerales bacterium]
MPDARLLTIAQLPVDQPMPLIARRRIMGDSMMVSDVLLSRGFVLETHQHENEQFVVLLSGHCTFGIGNKGDATYREVEVRSGQVLVLPSNVPHSCIAHEDTRILDLFSPPSAMTGVDRRP